MLQYPTNVSPENTAKPADATQMSFTFNGDRLSYINVKATDMATGERIGIGYYSEDMGNVLPCYNGDTVTFPPDHYAQGLTDGHNYTWQVLMAQRDLSGENNLYDIPVCRGSIKASTVDNTQIYIDQNLPLYEWGYNGNDDRYYPTVVDNVVMAGMIIEVNGERRFIESYKPNSGSGANGIAVIDSPFTTNPDVGNRYQIYANYLISPQYYFMCRELPTLILELDYERATDDSIASNINLCSKGTYSQSNDTPIKYYEMTLYAYTGNVEQLTPNLYKIKSSGKIFSQRLNYIFEDCLVGLNPENGEDITDINYRVVCDMVTQDNVVWSAYANMRIEGIVDYAPAAISHVWNPINGYGCCYDRNGGEGNSKYYRTNLDTGETIQLVSGEVMFDFKVSTKGRYRYTTIPYNALTGQPYLLSISHSEVETNFDGYFISALIPNGDHKYILTDTWKFICEIDDTTITQNIGNLLQVGYSKYTTMSSTENNYMTGTLSSYIGYLNCCSREYRDDIALINAWRTFISAPHPFLLKSQKGDVWVVNIVDSPQIEYQEDYYKIPTRFTFSWAECDDVNNISIQYYLDGNVSEFIDSEQYRCTPQTPQEYDVTSANDYIYYISGGEVVIIAYIGNFRNPQIPNEIDGFPVGRICATAFYKSVISSVRLPDNIRIIE